MFVIELILLRDSPSTAGMQDFDTGDASSGETGDVKLFTVVKKVLTNPIILTVALIEFCTGVIRNGVMHWFPIYAQEVWALPSQHILRNGSWSAAWLIGVMFAVAAVFFFLSRRFAGRRKAALIVSGALCALAPFIQGGWGGILFVAGVIGGNVAGWVSDLFFQSRRAPAAAGLYAMLAVCLGGMYFTLGDTTTEIGWTKKADYALKSGDTVVSVNGTGDLKRWTDVSKAVGCIPSKCTGEGVVWDTTACICTATPKTTAVADALKLSDGTIHLVVKRGDATLPVELKDPLVEARAGDARRLDAGPVLTLTPLFMGLILFLVSLGVIGTHGLLSGTATMDFGGRKGAATAVGMIDGFVYLGTAVQSVSLGYLTTRSWSYWPLFLVPFSIIGFLLLLRIWNAKPKGGGGH
jgi:sugar phosphate permease